MNILAILLVYLSVLLFCHASEDATLIAQFSAGSI